MSASFGSAAWPIPGKLEGVKTRSKVIVKARKGEIEVAGDRVYGFSNIAMSGESRILAVGAAGHAVAQMVLKKQSPKSGEIAHVVGLVMVHLGPHLAGVGASCDEHEAAVNDALRVKPHIVVLDEALAEGSQTWIQTFDKVLHNEAIRGFKGGVVVCVATEPVGPPCHGCNEKWADAQEPDSRILQTDVSSKLRLIQNAQDESTAGLESASKELSRKLGRESANVCIDTAVLMEAARELSEYCFEEDLFKVATRDDDTITLLTETFPSGMSCLCGYICYKFYQTPRAELHITRLAVPRSHRRRGLGKQLMQWIMGRAARAPTSEVQFITVTALETAVPFYAKFGFVVAPSREKLKEEDVTWMEIPNVSVVPKINRVAADPKVEPLVSTQAEPSRQACDTCEPISGSHGSDAGVVRVEGWRRHLSRKDQEARIRVIDTLLKNHKKKPSLTDEQRSQLFDEMEAMKRELQTTKNELAKRIKDVEKQLKASKKKNQPLSAERRFELMDELESLRNALTASDSKSR